MIIGVPRETKAGEGRVAITPHGAAVLSGDGHTVYVETGAGRVSGFADEAYRQAGADILTDAVDVFQTAELIVKVKEPQGDEWRRLRPGQILFAYLHLASSEVLTKGLIESGSIAIAYETVQSGGQLPLLVPMSAIAGRLATQVGARYLETGEGGPGVLLGGVPGVARASVVILGAGNAGRNAAQIALGMGARVTILDLDLSRLQAMEALFGRRVETRFSNEESVEEVIRDADLLIGCVLLPGARAPRVVSRAQVRRMKPGSVVVDLAIDQGGCIETSRPTTHDEPTFTTYGVTHYCVTNIPSLVARTATQALTNATLPLLRELAGKGWRKAAASNEGIASGLNVVEGRLTQEAVGRTFNLPHVPLSALSLDRK